MTTETLTLSAFLPRLARRVEIDGDGCWLWTGSMNRNGYGITTRPNSSRKVVAHRLFYELAIGEIPSGLDLDHLCRVRNCVNPEHLEPVTRRENLRRGKTLTARAIEATHCPAGHPYSDDNLYTSPAGFRFCRTCHREHVEATRRAHPDQEARHAQQRIYDANYRARKRAERSGK